MPSSMRRFIRGDVVKPMLLILLKFDNEFFSRVLSMILDVAGWITPAADSSWSGMA